MDIVHLAQAIDSHHADDALRLRFSPDQWRQLAGYLSRQELAQGELLIRQGDTDRTVYFLEQGSLQVFTRGAAAGAARLAILRPGSVVGELGLFSDRPRMAHVEAMTRCAVWALRGLRFEELTQRLPALAIELLRASGGVMAARLRASVATQAPVS
jgi:CRP/FNR family transcriptional regulator, cyclic AMP receptor protein